MTKLPIAIVGLNFGRHILDLLSQEPARDLFQVAGVCDLDLAKAQRVAGEIKTRAYRNLDEVLADPAVPAVGLYTPPSGRAGLVGRIVRAGKHVLTTKPFEFDAAAALAVLHEARRLGRVVHTNSPGPTLSPDLRQIKQWRAEYQLGRPVACRADVWVAYRGDRADGSWYDDPRRCPVAPVFRLGIYLINDLIGIFGPAARVQVLHERLFTGRPTPDNAQLAIQFQQGGLANVFASFAIGDGDKYRNSLVLNFEKGTVYRNCGPHRTPNVAADLSLVMLRNDERTVVAQATTPTMSGQYQWAEFHRAVSGTSLPEETTPEEIVAGVKILNAMARAEQSGATETVS